MILLIVLQGCKTYEYFTIDVLEPAEIYLPQNINKLLVTHNALPDTTKALGTVFKIFGNKISDTVFRDSAMAGLAIHTLSNMVELIGKMELECLDSIDIIYPDRADDYNVEMIRKIREMCEKRDADAFLILTSLLKEVSYDIYYGNFGNAFGEFAVVISTRWLLINPFASKLIDGKVIKDTLYLNVLKPFSRTIDDNYIRSIDLLNEAAIQTGILYGSYLSPHYAQTERMVFINGHKYLKQGYADALQGNWRGAALHWREALTVQNTKIRAKACFNLALANEMEGLLEPALEWAKESYLFFADTINSTYIKILEERLKDQDEIMQQMEGLKR